MSRKRSEEKTGLSPIQRKACVVMAFCVLAVVLSFLVSWILPAKLGLFGESDLYDPPVPAGYQPRLHPGAGGAQGNFINDTRLCGRHPGGVHVQRQQHHLKPVRPARMG